ncbi:GTPase HflX [Patescibacteria group bacterium]
MKRAILIDIIPKDESKEKAEKDLKELSSLVNTYGGIVIVNIIQKRGRPSAKTFLGTGKAQEVADIAKDEKADMVIANGLLKPNQVQHLHTLFKIPVWDRVDLILKIFDKHAKTEEAKMQIELATLQHEFPKLYGLGTRFSRIGGGIATRGPGEKYLEVQKRHLRARIKDIEKKLAGIRKIHKKQRNIRKRKGLKTAALVGYTNSGKSTLLKALTKKEKVYIANELFATLDSKIGDLWLPNIQKKILIADTIGFIRDLPPFLIKSFMATLDEVQEADLLLHVIDCSDSDMNEKVEVVDGILKNLGCEHKPLIYVFNKKDKAIDFKMPKRNAVKISARDGKGLEKLITKIEKAPI